MLRGLVEPYNLLYLIPIGVYGAVMLLRRFGVELDFLAASDTADIDRRRWSRVLFPNPDLRGVTLVLTLSSWAAVGLALNLSFPQAPFSGFRWVVFGVACGFGYGVGVLGTALIERVLPTEVHSTRLSDLVGRSATAVGNWTRPDFGRAHLTDSTGNRITVRCRWVGDPPLPRDGETITLVGFDPNTRTFEAMR